MDGCAFHSFMIVTGATFVPAETPGRKAGTHGRVAYLSGEYASTSHEPPSKATRANLGPDRVKTCGGTARRQGFPMTQRQEARSCSPTPGHDQGACHVKHALREPQRPLAPNTPGWIVRDDDQKTGASLP